MYRLLATCVILATVTAGAHGQLFPRWLSRGQLPAPRQHAAAAAASRDEALPTSAVDTVWSKAADGTGNSVMYFSEMKQELFVFGKAVPAPITSPGIPADTGAPSASTRAPATITSSPATSTRMPNKSTSAPVTSTSAPTTGLSARSISNNALLPSSTISPVPASITSPGIPADTDAPATSTRMPISSTSVPAMSTNAPTTITSTPATSWCTSAPTTSTSAPTTGTSAPSISSNVLLSSSTNPAASTSETSTTASAPTATSNTPPPTRTIPPGYTYYNATGSYYKTHESGVSWDVARITCASEGAHLTVLNDAQEADIVKRIAYDAGHLLTWTGLRDNRPGGVVQWRTVHGEPLSDVFHEWGGGRPTNNAEYTCAGFGTDNQRLYDVPCDWSYYFTCEISR